MRHAQQGVVARRRHASLGPTLAWLVTMVLGRPAASAAVRAQPRDSAPLPKLVAFDLDATLWYPEVDMMWGPPFRPGRTEGSLQDARGGRMALMGDSLRILRRLATDPAWRRAGVQVAYVSRTELPEDAVACLHALTLLPGPNDDDTDSSSSPAATAQQKPQRLSMYDLAQHHEIFPGRKTTHFNNIHQASGIPYDDMLFFDNEWRNIADCSRLGITCVHTPDGMTEAMWEEGLRAHAQKKAQQQQQQQQRQGAEAGSV